MKVVYKILIPEPGPTLILLNARKKLRRPTVLLMFLGGLGSTLLAPTKASLEHTREDICYIRLQNHRIICKLHELGTPGLHLMGSNQRCETSRTPRR